MIPALGKPRTVRLPTVEERVLGNGLRVVAVRRPGVPLAEVRLAVPFAGTGRRHLARTHLLADTFFSGTERRSAVELAAALQALGADLHASTSSDLLSLGGSALVDGLPGLLALLAEVLTSNAYPKDDVAGERERSLQELVLARSQPAVLAAEALSARLYGDHPYGRDLPLPDDLAQVRPRELRTLHDERVSPSAALLVVVGDLATSKALDLAEGALASWPRGVASPDLPAPPPVAMGQLRLIDRPGAVQSNIRLGGPAPRRSDPDYAALVLANTVFGGYFSSRLVANIREDKGYTYSPRSLVDHAASVSQLSVAADVATAVTAPALMETIYELGRIATTPVTQAELDAARAYVIGSLALSTSTQAGLASTLVRLIPAGLGIEWLREHPKALGAVTVEAVQDAACRWLAPGRLVSLVLGDASVVQGSLQALGGVEAG